MLQYKRNQVEDAIFRTLGAKDAERIEELKLRLKRLLVTDRRSERVGRQYAFYTQEQPGSGIEVKFSAYEAFALLAAVMLLEHGLTQERVVSVMRQVRQKLEAAHSDILKKDEATLYDQKIIDANREPGVIAVDNTDPVFVAFIRLTGSSVGPQKGDTPVVVCRGQKEFAAFMNRHRIPGLGVTIFEHVRRMRILADNLARTRPIMRGRGAS